MECEHRRWAAKTEVELARTVQGIAVGASVTLTVKCEGCGRELLFDGQPKVVLEAEL